MTLRAFRGSIFHLLDNPARSGAPLEGYFADGGLIVEEDFVVEAGDWARIGPKLNDDVVVTHYPDALIVPGFVDAHVHYPQLDIIASPSRQLLDWLNTHTFPAESRFADRAVADEAAGFFLDELLRHGTTTALVFATVHPGSVEALFEAALARNMRIASGKVLMDRNAPPGLCDTAESGYDDSDTLIATWHGRGRLSYAVTPRFAVTSSDRQLELAGKLLRGNPGVLLHTHISENAEEIATVRRLFPDCADYLAVYEKFGLATDRSVFAHAIHLTADEWHRMGRHGSSVAFCPTSNLFLGSGLFDAAHAQGEHVCVGLGTDVGGGTSLSLLQTMNEAFKVGQLRRHMFDPFQLFYMATLGGAKALKLDGKIGNFLPGMEADFVVLDMAATPLLRRRITHAESLADRLFALAMLGDDRAVAHTYVAGRRAHSRA